MKKNLSTIIYIFVLITVVGLLSAIFSGTKSSTNNTTSNKKEDVEESPLEFTLSDDGTYYSVTGIGTHKTSGVLIIPETYKNLPVKKISYDFPQTFDSIVLSITYLDDIQTDAFQGNLNSDSISLYLYGSFSGDFMEDDISFNVFHDDVFMGTDLYMCEPLIYLYLEHDNFSSDGSSSYDGYWRYVNGVPTPW